jgi:glutamate dehydrogenase (NAD(P)+)
MASTEHAPSFAHLEFDTPLYRTAIAQFDEAVRYADIDDGIAERLRYPERAIIVSCPTRLDDGRRVIFPGYRVQHSSVLGPTKGGIRFDAEVTLGECGALAVWMTWKCALLRLPYGGAKGGVRCSPRTMSLGELERLTRRFTSELLPFIGPKEDIPAPDMATNEQTMAWMMDTYSMQRGHAVPEIVTGKPISIGGSVFRNEATGAGVVMVVAQACERLGWQLAQQRCVVQGFGNVGSIAAQELVGRGATVVGVSDVSGGIHDPGGLDIVAMTEFVREYGSLEGWDTGTRIAGDELLELECDILVLAAREDQIHGDNAKRLRCRMVAEGANGPTSLEGDAVLRERGIPVLPDILTNAGGVTVSYFEWVQDLGRLFWGRDEIRARLAEKLTDAFDRVWDVSEQRGIPMRTAALVAGIRDVAAALEARGMYP